jgi:hypothetical protein
MEINEYLNARALPALDEPTLEAMKEFIDGTHMALASQSVKAIVEQHAWQRENTLTKREQFAGFASIGLVEYVSNSYDVNKMVKEAYLIADHMLQEQGDD